MKWPMKALVKALRIGYSRVSEPETLGWPRGLSPIPKPKTCIQKHLHGANLDIVYSIEEEGDHLAMIFEDNDQPGSNGYPGTNSFDKGQTWGSVGKIRSEQADRIP